MLNDHQLTLRTEPTAYSPIVARVPITVRAGTMDDLPFIDRLQKQHSRELGFLPMAALAGKVRLGQVLIAEVESEELRVESENGGILSAPHSPLSASHSPLPSPIAYLIAADRYQKRDEIGYVTQINVVPEHRRSLVAAQLLQAQFDRSAYGCRLYCCWCAQDLKANEFWEAMGFTAIAFRTGSMTKGAKKTPRVHIFWQKRIRAGDTGDLASGGTAWWYPSQTGGGEIREDRLVFPILPGVHWRDVGPIVLESGVLPTSEPVGRDDIAPVLEQASQSAGVQPALPGSVESVPVRKPRKSRAKKEIAPPAPLTKTVLVSPNVLGGFWFPEQGVAKEVPLPPEELPAEAIVEKPKRTKAAREKTKIDPRLTAMSRELRDRWGEQNESIPALPGRHDICRQVQSNTEPAWRTTRMAIEASPTLALPNAA